jgi:DNA repair protein RadD
VIQELREYQTNAVTGTLAAWETGKRAVCLVAPTGAGKTRIGEELIACDDPCVWVAHRTDLVTQTVKRLAMRFGSRDVGIIMAGERESPRARIQVGTVQTLIVRDSLPPCSRLVLDEAHHYVAEAWRVLRERLGNPRTVGPTATPERGDGTPLGDVFDHLIVAAKYSELLVEKHLVPVRLYRPEQDLGNDLAEDPHDAWFKLAEGSRTFVFCARVAIAERVAQKFRDLGVMAGVIHDKTPTRERADLLESFRRGRHVLLCNVNTMTEGIDVPEARCCLLMRGFEHVGAYLQAAGRVLRAAKEKEDAILIDLCGSSKRHGSPTKDREYSLAGRAISGLEWGGGTAPEREEFTQEVKGVGLTMVARGALPSEAQADAVELTRVDDSDREAEFRRLLKNVRALGMRSGFAHAAYRDRYGEEPKEEWRQ